MSGLDFGDYCEIEQKRFGVKNEMYFYKVIGRLCSNAYVDVPVQGQAANVLHDEIVPVLTCICCGVCEETVLKFREQDCQPINDKQNSREET